MGSFAAADMIEEFINESRAIYASLNLNISSILLETQLIIGEIDSIVSDLGSLYNDLNKVRAWTIWEGALGCECGRWCGWYKPIPLRYCWPCMWATRSSLDG